MGPTTNDSKAPAPKKDVAPPTQSLCPSGGDSPVRQSPPVLEYAKVLPRSQRKKHAQQQQLPQNSKYMNCDLATVQVWHDTDHFGLINQAY